MSDEKKANDIHVYVGTKEEKEYLESIIYESENRRSLLELSRKELDKYQDKVYHSTRLIEQLEHELELLRKVIQLQREGLEKIAAIKTLGDINLYVFYKELDKQDLEEMCLDDTELARQTLKEVDELLKGER